MTQPNFKATLTPIGHGHASPPVVFLATILAWCKGELPPLFDPNPNFDIYSIVKDKVSIDGEVQRRAIACEALRVIGGDESDWNWKEGRDITAGPETPDQEEAGAFQVSYDSNKLGRDLNIFLLQNRITSPGQFIQRMKVDPTFDCAYTFRLLRVSTRWDGPINRGWVHDQFNVDAVKEWAALLG